MIIKMADICSPQEGSSLTYKTWRTWTRKEDKQLEDLRMLGYSCSQIAQKMHRTVPSVKMRVMEKEVERFRPRQEQWLALLSVPHNLKEVAARMGVDYRSAVRQKNRLRKSGLDIPEATRGPVRTGPASQDDE